MRDRALLAAALCAALAAPLVAAAAPRPGQPLAAVFAPSLAGPEATRRLDKADAAIVARGAGDAVAIVVDQRVAPMADFIARLREAGAVLVVDAAAVAWFCAPEGGVGRGY